MEQFYQPVKDIHNILRWVVLIIGIAAVLLYALGAFRKNPFTKLHDRISLFFTATCDVQLLLGLFLYFFLSPVTQNFLQFGRNAVEGESTVRFYALEHPSAMILGILFAHIGRTAVKRAKTDQVKMRRGALWFSLAMLFQLSRVPW